ncbi:MAG: threonine/serine dehydratase [Acidobacteriota bacterium]
MSQGSDQASPITYEDIVAARARIRPHLPPTPLRRYAPLDAAVGCGIRVAVKHEDHNPTNAFKVRNALSALTAMEPGERARGVVGATRGNYGLGLAWAGRLLGVPVTICVPEGNNPEKNEAMVGLGAELVIDGADYDASLAVAERIGVERGMRLVHSTNDAGVLAGAGTIALEMLEQDPRLDALVVAVGGGSQAVGAMTVARRKRPSLPVFAVQAAGAPAIHDSWHAGRPLRTAAAETFADGLATRSTYPMTFPSLLVGLAGFVTVTDAEIASALRLLLRTTHTLAEGAGAAGLAGLIKMRQALAGRSVAIVVTGANIDEPTLKRVLNHEL